ncbi:MAG TPA: M56 family metallopeptidase [Tepidisphaeraceae bacterium]|nr:M56 family metallopeptidase [Tepidisphaeraceae bacterium]
MTTLLNGLWQGAMLVALVWIMLKIVPRLNAATRYVIWWITMLVAVILPLLPMVPGTALRGSQSSEALASNRESVLLMPVRAVNIPAFIQIHSAPLASADGALSPTADGSKPWFPIRVRVGPISGTIAVVWVIASLSLLVRLASGYHSLRRLKHRAIPASERLQARVGQLAANAGISRQARLMISKDVAAPMALGLFDPVILIPQSLPAQMSGADFDHMALHELAHLRRRDDWVNLLQHLLIALLPIQPMLFWIGRELSLERETACDDWVVAFTGTAKPYAASLARIAELTLWARCGILASGAAGRPSQLYRRVQHLLDKRRNITPTVSMMPLALGVTAVIALAWMALSTPEMIALADPPAAEKGAAPSAADVQGQPSTQPAEPGMLVRSFTVQPGDKLVVDVDRGNIHLRGDDQSTVQIAVAQKGPNLAEFLKHHHIKIIQEGHEVDIRAAADESYPSLGSNVDVEIEITVPKKFEAHLKDGGGKAEVAGIDGILDATTGGGNVELKDCSGQLNATTGGGNVELEKVSGSLEGHTGAGNIEAKDCTASLWLSTGNGNIELEKIGGSVDGRAGSGNFEATDCTGELKASVGMGNIEIDRFTGPSVTAQTGAGNVTADLLDQPKADCSLRSSMGNVDVKLKQTIAVNLSASAGVGRMHSEFPMGAINGGGPNVQIETGMGNVQVLKQ